MAEATTRRLANGNLLVSVPINLRWGGNSNGRRVISADGIERNAAQDSFMLSLARGRRWQKLIDAGRMPSSRAIAKAIGKDVGFVARCIRLTYLCPDIIEKAAGGEIPMGLSANLTRQSIPDSWDEQKEMLLGQ